MNPAKRTHTSFPLSTQLVALLAFAACSVATSATCTGKHADMQSYAGNDASGQNLPATPLIAARLQRLPAQVRAHLWRNLEVAGSIDLVGCALVLRGNAPHMGGEENAILDVDLYSGAVTVAIHSGGHTDIYLDARPAASTPGDPYDAVPGTVKDWAVLADMGFPYQRPMSVRVHTPPH